MIPSSSVQIQSHWQKEKIEEKPERFLYKWAVCQCDQIGQNFAYFLLNQFSPNKSSFGTWIVEVISRFQKLFDVLDLGF
jgi:hypothetical protein